MYIIARANIWLVSYDGVHNIYPLVSASKGSEQVAASLRLSSSDIAVFAVLILLLLLLFVCFFTWPTEASVLDD